jgi:hypothetical protein
MIMLVRFLSVLLAVAVYYAILGTSTSSAQNHQAMKGVLSNCPVAAVLTVQLDQCSSALLVVLVVLVAMSV